MRTFACLLLFFAATAIAADKVVPIYEEPRHRLVLDNGTERILNLSVPPGDTTLYHVHDQPIFYVTLSFTQLRTQVQGGGWTSQPMEPWAPGDVMVDDSYVDQPTTHRVENIGADDLHLIIVLNERDKQRTSGMDVYSRLPGIPDIDTEYFAQSRIEIGPGEFLDWGGVQSKIVFVLVSDTHVVLRNNKEDRLARGMTDAGDFEYVDGGDGFRFENRSGEPATIIAVAVL